MADLNQLIGAYVKLRDAKKELADRHKEELAPYNQKMQLIENALLAVLNNSNAKNIATNNGTAAVVNRESVKILDWEQTLPFILEHDLTHLLVRRLAAEGVREFVNANGHLPPGVDITVDRTVQVRRSSKK